MAAITSSPKFNFQPYLDFLFMTILRGKENDPAVEQSKRVLSYALDRSSPRLIDDNESRFTQRNIEHLVRAFPHEGRKTGGMDERHYFQVAAILTETGADRDTITSGLFHDYTEEKLDQMQEKKPEDAENKIRNIQEELEAFLFGNIVESYPSQSMINSARRAQRLVAINYKLTRNPKNAYTDSMQHLLFPMQGIFTFEDILEDLEEIKCPKTAEILYRQRRHYGDLSRKELEAGVWKLAKDGKVSVREARQATTHLQNEYTTHYSLPDIIRVFLVKSADRIENVGSHSRIEQSEEIPKSLCKEEESYVAMLADLLRNDPMEAKEAVHEFNEGHPPRDMENHQIAYSVAKTLLFANVGKLFFLQHDIRERCQRSSLEEAARKMYTRLIHATQEQIRKTLPELITGEDRSRYVREIQDYETQGKMERVTHREPTSPFDRRAGYYGYDGTLGQYMGWMTKNKQDMEKHRNRHARIGRDLMAFDRLLCRLLKEPSYFIQGLTPRAEEYLQEPHTTT